MEKIVIASMRRDAGKTSLITGMARALGRSIGYMKPLGDRLLYRKKRLWDHDSALVTGLFNPTTDPQFLNIGFDHAKLRYMYTEASTRDKLRQAAEQIGAGKELLFVESGRDLAYGISVNLDPVFVAESIGARVLLVISGDENVVLDDIILAKKYLDTTAVELNGVLINKLPDVESFKDIYLEQVQSMGVKVLGMIPHQAELTYFSLHFLADQLLAKVVAGEAGLNRLARNVLVGAMSVDAVLRNPVMNREDILMITSGDRTDMILAALESDTVGMVLTNNILPPPNILAKASERGIPLLLVPGDTYATAKQIDDMQPLLTADDADRIALLAQLAQTHINLEEIIPA